MQAIKQSPEAFVTFGLLRLIGYTSPGLVSWAINLFGTKATTVLTNVPGPREALHLAGRAVDGLMFWVPQSGNLGLGISILSYRGGVRVGIASDAALLPDPESLVAAYSRALDELKGRARHPEPKRRIAEYGRYRAVLRFAQDDENYLVVSSTTDSPRD